MNTDATNQEQKERPTYIEPKIFLSRDGEYLTILVPGNFIIRKHTNYFKKLLGVAFTPKSKHESTTEVSAL